MHFSISVPGFQTQLMFWALMSSGTFHEAFNIIQLPKHKGKPKEKNQPNYPIKLGKTS